MQRGTRKNAPRRKIGNQGKRVDPILNMRGKTFTINNVPADFFVGIVDAVYETIRKTRHRNNIKIGDRLDSDILMLYTNLIADDPDYKLAGEVKPTIVNLRKNLLKILKDTNKKGNENTQYATDLFNRFMDYFPIYERILEQKKDEENRAKKQEIAEYERYKHTDAYKRSIDPYYGSGSTVDPYSGVSWGNNSGVQAPGGGGGGGGGTYEPKPWNQVYPEGWGGGRRRTKRRSTRRSLF